MTPTETLQAMMDVDAWVWAHVNKIKLQASQFLKAGHEFLIEPMQSTAKKQVKMKGAQLGFSEGEILKSVHGLIKRLYPRGVLYLFPNQTDVSDFSKSRFAPLIADNYEAIGRHVRNTDAANIKQIGKGVLYLRGARITQRVGGKPESSKLRSIPVDKLVCDERDLMPDEMVALALERMSHSDVQEESYLSTPTIPDFGIDSLWQESDQRLWFIKCEKCNTETCLELEFPECIKWGGDKHYRACRKCSAEIFPKNGTWRPQVESDVAGWRISQLCSMYVEPGKILKMYQSPGDYKTTTQEVYNSKLALPYIAAENRLTLQDVYACCGNNMSLTSSAGPCAMGVDVGKELHVVIGGKIAPKQYRIIKEIAVPKWNDVHDLAYKFNVETAVIDMYPEMHKAREFQGQEPYEIFLCEYSEHLSTGHQWNHQKGEVTVNRTEVCDETHTLVTTPGMLLLSRMNEQIKDYAKQMINMAKVLEEDSETGAHIYRYRKLGIDHWRHATNYFYLAAQRVGILKENERASIRQTTAIDDYAYI